MSGAGRGRKANSRAKKQESLPPRTAFDIPYFAHQQLDPGRYPQVLTYPIAQSPAVIFRNVKNCAVETVEWDEEDDARDVYDPNSEDSSKAHSFENTKNSTASSSQGNELSSRGPRVKGGRPAISKPVTPDLDTEDQIIVRMKQAKYLERDIAKYLADQGLIKYNIKTIGTRWARIKKKLAEHQDELLDADLTDWHDGDDDVLREAIAKADKEIEAEVEKVRAKKWQKVAEYSKAMKPVMNFSQNACRKRYDALLDGSAKPAPESIVNPDEDTMARIQSRKEKENKIEEDRLAKPGSKAAIREKNVPQDT